MTAHQTIYQCLFHGFNNNLSKNAVASIYKIYKELEVEDIHELCVKASKTKTFLAPNLRK